MHNVDGTSGQDTHGVGETACNNVCQTLLMCGVVSLSTLSHRVMRTDVPVFVDRGGVSVISTTFALYKRPFLMSDYALELQ